MGVKIAMLLDVTIATPTTCASHHHFATIFFPTTIWLLETFAG
jgi:hypothetical protein